MMNNNAYPRSENNPLKVAIKEDQVTVAPESRALLHVGIVNESTEEDYFDVVIRGVPPEWVTLPTPVVHLAAGEAKLVTITIQPRALGEQRVVQYPLDVRVVSQKDSKRAAVARSMLTVAAYQSRGHVGVALASVHFSVAPGTIVDIPILLQNRGDEDDSFRLHVRGLPENWVSTNSTVTMLESNSAVEIQLTLQIPRSSLALAGRHPFTIQVTSQMYPSQSSEVECILTVSAFSQFSTSLEPSPIQAGQFGQVIIDNAGNTLDTYSLGFRSPENELIFEKAVQVARPGSQPGTQQYQTVFVEIPQGERIQVRAGERGTYSFRPRLRTRPILGGEQTYPFTAYVRSTGNETAELPAQVSETGYIPFWVLPVGIGALLLVCLLLLIPLWNIPTSARATQTAAFNQTQAALSGTSDSDGDGLTNDREVALGTDPLKPDTDGDKLTDREEVETRMTNPLDPDTDHDGLQDGAEVQTTQTDPRNPDTDGDGLSDGDEVIRQTDPRNPDTDGDGLKDGDEVKLETDPRNPDTDGDGLKDGQENANCPRPRVPDSDGDGIIDGKDLDPCNPSNPSLTATAAAVLTAGAPLPSQTPSITPIPTNIPTATPTATPTLVAPSLSGIMLFGTDRDGNAEIYGLNLANQTLARLTNNAAQDVQPALAPDSVQVAYVTNQDGNNEIYLGGVDGRTPTNLTKNPADDQQPTWSPDGNWIAFTTNRDGNQEIYVISKDGATVRNLTNNPASDFAPSWFSVPGFLGNEDWIAFTTTRDGNQEVYKVRPDGTGLTNLTQNPANDHSPSGFPTGTTLAFVSDRTGNWEIFTMTDKGAAQTNITNNPAQDIDPAIKRGGNWIAFSTNRDGNLEIYVVSINGGPAFNMTKNPGQDRYPDW